MKKFNSIILGAIFLVSLLELINPVSAATIVVNPGIGTPIQDAINAANAGDTILVNAGTYNENIVIDKSLTLIGNSKTTTIIKPEANATNWILIQSTGVNIKNFTFDGEGFSIRSGIRTQGSGSITNCIIKNIHQAKYLGFGISFDYNVTGQDWQITGNEFHNIERVGVWIGGQGNKATISGNIIEGNGEGDWVGYGIEVEMSAVAYIEDNHISGYKGVASSDGSESAAIMITSYFGPNPKAYITGNTLTDNTTGILVGYEEGDTSFITANNNNISGNKYGIVNLTPHILDVTNNWWGSNAGPPPGYIVGNTKYFPWDKKASLPINSIMKILDSNKQKKQQKES
jgi:nitrous oxidase accessory protein NosD